MITDWTRLGPPRGSRLLVAGGCGGIGRALVDAALATGVEVAVLDLPASIAAHPPPLPVFVRGCDASDEHGIDEAFAELRLHWGRPDAFVNLVGFRNSEQRIGDLGLAEWTAAIDGNLSSAFLLSRAAVRAMQGRGALVHVSSGLGSYAGPGYGGYAVAKGALNTLTRMLAREYAPGLRANVVAPGLVDTAFIRGGTGRCDGAGDPRVDIAEYATRVPLGRVATPDDVVGPILFLCGPASGFVTGQILHVNGGAYLP
jgi:NAD(P)-dependent dehydrogenase (short-subunit alcohol dehydrogenase family)